MKSATIFSLKISLLTVLNVFIVNYYMLVSIRSALLVVETKAVSNFMHNNSFSPTTLCQRNSSLVFAIANRRGATKNYVKGMGYV